MKFDVTTNSNTQVTPPADDAGVLTSVGAGGSGSPHFARGGLGGGSDSLPSIAEDKDALKTASVNEYVSSVLDQVAEPFTDIDTTTAPTTTLSQTLPAITTTKEKTPNSSDSLTEFENAPETVKRHHDGMANPHDLDKKLSDVRSIEEEALTKKIAGNWNMRYVDLAGVTVETDALMLVPQKTANIARATGFKINNKSVSVALENPNSVDARAVIKDISRAGYTVTPYLVSPHSMSKLMDRYADLRLTTKSHGGMIDMDATRIATISEHVHNNSDVRAIIDELLARPREQGVTSELLEIIMGSAIATKSSDIHIESQEHNVRLRMRQDGVLEDVYELPHDINKSLAARIKILSGLKLTITKDAQDGRFTVSYADTQIEIRVSTIPGPYGEGIVMRVLDPRGLTVSFEKLGIESKLMEIFMREIEKPEGIILTTGPTGSGKTTTLYSFLQSIYDPEIKIITIEDPIEYHLAGIQQTQVDHEKGYDFLSGLRAAMRQDPEVIMVGEIRDAETANTAIQAAQTGHLVLSTLHTNNAAGVIPRLLGLGVNSGLLASTLRMAIAQRLVRRLITETKIARPATEKEITIIRKVLSNAIANNKDIARFGMAHDATEYTVYDAVPAGESTGYKGRIGIYEVIVMDNEIEKLLEKNPSEREVRNAAEHQGLLTMQEDAIIKILQGVTSFDEVTSVIDLESGYEDTPSAGRSPFLGEGQSRVLDPDNISFKNPRPNFHMDSAQLETMWEYLKTLRTEQEYQPDDSRADQIRDTEIIILDIMKRNHGISGTLPQNTGALIQREAQELADELADLREHARAHPDPAIAKKLQQMHAIMDAE